VALSLSAQTFTTLHSFDYTDGAFPVAPLVQATNGNLYGTTESGANPCGGFSLGCGTVFEITPSGKLTTLYSFCPQSGCADGSNPYAGLIQATNGYLYGTTFFGGAYGVGTVFKVTPKGKLTTLYNFPAGSDAANPEGALVQATDGDFYGTSSDGGADDCYEGSACGTVFKITPKGKATTLFGFPEGTDGAVPVAGLIQANDGNFYGTASLGGANDSCDYGFGCGTVFKITSKGNLTVLYNFCSQTNCTDGANPVASLVQSTDGDFYGMAPAGGANGYGTVFKITRSGKLTTLYSFCSQTNCTDGANPAAALIQATDGNFYGTTSLGGANGGGTIFKITPRGKLTTLYSFCSQTNCTDGNAPVAALIQDTNGDFYGTTNSGGTNVCRTGHTDPHCGTAFSLSVGLGPFVKTQPGSGKVGAAVEILGTDLTGATSVTFNGTAATFKVVSASFIKTTVPTGATTGSVEVTIPSGTLKSNVAFRVTK
jgi:uncharacterized repeat protein (TIGR03803 family)